MKTNVYVDNFNLYYGSLKDTPYRWLDILAMCRMELPSNTINRIRCFTARVIARPIDPDQRNRQNAYLRALATLPNLSIHYGQFLESEVRMRTVTPPPNTVLVRKTEEKGSDVNLASYMLLDGFRNEYEAAVVISNDSDLVEPIRIVRKELGLKVVLLMPCRPVSNSQDSDKASTYPINDPCGLPIPTYFDRRQRHHYQARDLVASQSLHLGYDPRRHAGLVDAHAESAVIQPRCKESFHNVWTCPATSYTGSNNAVRVRLCAAAHAGGRHQ